MCPDTPGLTSGGLHAEPKSSRVDDAQNVVGRINGPPLFGLNVKLLVVSSSSKLGGAYMPTAPGSRSEYILVSGRLLPLDPITAMNAFCEDP